ncbi:MAG: tetratricopeptide repeat protein [Bacteroidales bacterium]|nr:tetratricopeptide repeat protein [Bacteroidales bacterium]
MRSGGILIYTFLCVLGPVSAGIPGDPTGRLAPVTAAGTLPDGNTWQVAARLAQSGDYEKAAALYASAYAQDPNPVLYRQYLEVLLKLDRYKEAEALALRQMRSASKGGRDGLPQALARYRVDLGQIYLAQGAASKAQKAFSQAVDDYWTQGGVGAGVSLDELSEALWTQSGTARYSAALYEAGRRAQPSAQADGCLPFAYELFKAYLHLGQMDRMTAEALCFVQPKREGGGYEEAMAQIEADWQAYFYQAGPAAATAQSPAFRLKKALYAYWQKDPLNREVAEWLRWVALQDGDYEEALRMAAAFKDFHYDGGVKLLETIRLIIDNGADAVAVAALENLSAQAEERPDDYLPDVRRAARQELLGLQFRRLEQGRLTDSAELARLKADYETLWRQSPQAAADPQLWPVARNLARIYAYYTHEDTAAEALMERCIAQGRVTARRRAEMKTEYADMLLFMGKTWDAMLLYAQVEKDFKQDDVGFYAKLQTARLSYYVGEFEWALSQLEVLRAATSKLIANDAMELSLLIKENNNADSTYAGLRRVARADALTYRRLYAPALQVLDSVLRMPGESQLHDDVYYKKAQIYRQTDSIEAAIAALERVYRQPAGQPASLWADDALLQASACYEALGQRDKAMEACRELFTRFPSSLLAPQAVERYRSLRAMSNADKTTNL